MCFSKLFSFFKSGKKSKHILDGNGMINTLYAESFSVSRSGDSYAQQNFYISVKRTDGGYAAKGTLLDDDGTEYNAEEGIALSKSACRAIDELNPEQLPNVAAPTGIEESGETEEMIICDAPSIEIEVILSNGCLRKKIDHDGFSMKVYEIVLPCFRKQSK